MTAMTMMLWMARVRQSPPVRMFGYLMVAAVSLLAVAVAWAQLPLEPPDPMVGKAAPAIVLNLMDGGKLDLPALKGKIVVLDFFATWCKYCQLSLPVGAKATAKYKDKDVLFFAINIGTTEGLYHLDEEPTQIKAFLGKLGVEAPVALDTKLDASNKFYVNGPPQTFIIGKDGTVEVVERGFRMGHRGQPMTQEVLNEAMADAEKVMSQQLETLIAGKSLVQKVEPKK